MKGVFILLVAVLFDVCVYAQNEKGQLVINLGIGYSPGFDGDITFLNSQIYPVGLSNSWDPDFNFQCSAIPNIGLTLDYGVFKRLSTGIATSYQNENVKWGFESNQLYFSDNVTRINTSARILFHLNKDNPDANMDFDHYIGIRPGFCYWRDIPSSNNQTINNGFDETTFLNHPNYFTFCFQVLYGMRLYLVNDLAFHFEVGIGQPFLIECGFTYRIQTRKED